jgi:tetratricopeptide (TPR) repeat protein
VRAEAEAETAKQTTRFMVDLFKVSDPSEALGNTITAREILDKGAARIDVELAAQPAIQATLMDTMGTVYTSLGLYSSAIPLAREALDKRRLLPEHNDAAIAESLSHLGIALSRNADFPEAEQRLREALAMQRKTFGNNSAEVATTLSALADVMSFMASTTRASRSSRKRCGYAKLYAARIPSPRASATSASILASAVISSRPMRTCTRHSPCSASCTAASTPTWPKRSTISPGH